MLPRFITRTAVLAACIFCFGLAQTVAQTSDQIDWNRAKQIHERFVRGEKLTEEEQAYHDRAAKAIQANAGKQPSDGIDWKRAQQIHERFVRGEKLTEEEQAYHDRAAKALQAKAGKKPDDGIDWKRANQLHERLSRGERLTAEEQAYHDRAAKTMQASRQPPPAKPPTGLKPVTDMTAEDRYKGQDGGLYGGGKNEPPEKHLQAAMQQAKLIRPLDADGKSSDDGKIVLISVGMSNTTQEFSTFVRLANADSEKSPNVVIVDGAQGGQTANVWANPSTRR
jgi:ribosome assembly protein YihI (activator of Der GTPase)